MTAPARIQSAGHADMVNDGEPCRQCRGNKGHYERSYTGGYVFEPCFWCRGTGCQTIRIDPVRA